MKKNTAFLKAAAKAAGLLAVLLVMGLGLTGCPTEDNGGGGGNGGDGGGGKPAKLSEGAGYNEIAAKIDEVIEYCNNNPGMMNIGVKANVTLLKEMLANNWQDYNTNPDNWTGLGFVRAVNGQIDYLE
jgi:hypothetical protein